MYRISSLITVLFLAARLPAQTLPIEIADARFGFPSHRSGDGYLFKPARWVPVWIDLKFPGGINAEKVEFQVSTPDGDDVISVARELVSANRIETTGRHLMYLKPGSLNAEIEVRIVDAATKQPLATPFRGRQAGRGQNRHFILTAGSKPPAVRLPRIEGQVGDALADGEPLRQGLVEHLHIERADQMPDRWFGYQSIDLLILSAGENSFWDELNRDASRRDAMAEWVRRGGRVVISVGRELSLGGVTVRRFGPASSVSEIPLLLPNAPRLIVKSGNGAPFEIAMMKASSDRVKLLTDDAENPLPLVMQIPWGLGRVTCVAFDLAHPAFSAWNQRELFWDWLLNQAGTRLPTGNEANANEDPDKYLSRLQNNLEHFEQVPVISFGWVAMLILAYIVLIGPVEYLILKRILKRMELTWLTMPIIVAGVCVAAYVAAIESKGRELRINKVDVVDVDLRDGTICGQTWFTLFSPRIESYRIDVLPRIVESPPDQSLVSWHGSARSTRQSLLRRSYDYGRDGFNYTGGLNNVVIQVWSTKSFTAQWSGKPAVPLIESTLRIATADAGQITGSITSRLPIDLIQNAQLIYRDRVIPVPPLVRDVPRFVSSTSAVGTASSFFQQDTVQQDLVTVARAGRAPIGDYDDDPRFRFWPILFHEAIHGQFNRVSNSAFRELDQSWRVGERSPHEAWLIVRLPGRYGSAAEVQSLPESPTAIDLGQPPTGTLRQDTYLRVLIPIAPARP